METLIYEVKRVSFKSGNVLQNTWRVGQLKNKNIFGEDIPSQILTQEITNDDSSESMDESGEADSEILAGIENSRPSDRFGD